MVLVLRCGLGLLRGQVSADPVLLHTLLHVGRALHDSLDSLSFSGFGSLLFFFFGRLDGTRSLMYFLIILADEQRQVSDLMVGFISKVKLALHGL